MDQSVEHVREISNTLYRYHLDNFLCDVYIVTPDGNEVPAHSIVLSAVSVKLRAAFEKSDNGVKKNYAFKLYVSDCDVATVELVLQFVYTGAIILPHDTPLDITRVLSAGQKLGLDANKLATFLGAMLCLTDASVMENLPPVILTDEDICLEIVEKGGLASLTKSHGRSLLRTSEIIRITSREAPKLLASDHQLDHCYTQHVSQKSPTNEDSKKSPLIEEQSVIVNVDSKPSQNLDNALDLIQDIPFARPPEGDLDSGAMLSVASSCFTLSMAEPDVNVSNSSNTQVSNLNHSENESLLPLPVMVVPHSSSPSDLQSNEVATASCENKSSDFDLGTVISRKDRIIRRTRSGLSGIRERVIHICDHCGKSFTRSKEFAEHRRTHTGERPFSCDICGKGFSRVRSVAEHRRQHTGEKPFVCDTCAKPFFTSGELIKHRRYHSGEKPYHCEVCGKEFMRCGEYADHRRVHAGENACPICGKEFTRLHNMKEHVNSAHTGAKRYACVTCGKQFAYSSGLRYHRRLHKTDRPFRCDLCGRSFARMGELSRHERNSHKVIDVQVQV